MDNGKHGAGDHAGGIAAGAALTAGGAAAAAAELYRRDQAETVSSMPGSGTADDMADRLSIAKAKHLLTPYEASRFLAQATCGATRSEIDRLCKIGYDRWLDAQFTMPRSQSHWEWMESQGVHKDTRYANGGNANDWWDRSIWRQLITAPDQLRQRVGMALLDIFVVSITDLRQTWPQFAMAAYMDLLLDHAFGNFRDLMAAVTTNHAMATFLTTLGSEKENGKGRMPDENYAREFLQLFTLGVDRLNPDGTVIMQNGQPVETYTQDDITQLARVLTGMRPVSWDQNDYKRHRQPLIFNPATNETGASTVLGKTVSGGGMTALNEALDIIFNHPNAAPFVSAALIRRISRSNPDRNYIGRVAAVFRNNGRGVRGDLKAVIRAILMDPHARGEAALTAAHTGKLREPVLRLLNWARALGATSNSGRWLIGRTERQQALGQSPGRAHSVFGFFSPGYSPPNTALMSKGMVAPELQLANEQSVVAYINYFYVANRSGINRDVMPNYKPLLPLAKDPPALVEELNQLLAAGQLSDAARGIIVPAIAGMRGGSERYLLERIHQAILLVMASPDYLVLR